ncbi:hypothetical protein [Tolypothrix sp. PCC 7910]|nr:hypothetical protein [Tolypothrix sp. PCC 7910]
MTYVYSMDDAVVTLSDRTSSKNILGAISYAGRNAIATNFVIVVL